MKKIAFMGTPAFSVPILEGLIEAGYEITAVVTQPDRPVGRKKVLTAPPVKEAAVKHGLFVLQPEKITGSPEMEQLMTMDLDLIVTAAFGQFLPEKLLMHPTHGAINVHASLLPRYRGGAPVHYAIMDGEKETGISIIEMIKKMDAGRIFAQRVLPITAQDDVGSMFEKLSLLGRDTLLSTLPNILDGSAESWPQKEDQVTFSPNITKEEEQIDWRKRAEAVDWQVRGMRPWPVAYTVYHQQRWKLWAVTVVPETTEADPGTVIKRTKKELWIAAGEGTIVQIDRLQPAGKGQLTISEFLNGIGQAIQVGDQLEVYHS